MSTGLEYVPYILAAVGTYANYQANTDAAKERSRLLGLAGEEAAKANDKREKTLVDAAAQYDPMTRAANQDAEKSALVQQLDTALSDAAVPQSSSNYEGTVSNAFAADKTAKTADAKTKSDRLNQLFAAIQAPTQLRLKEGINSGRAAQDANIIAANGKNFVNAQRDAASLVTPNAGLQLFGGLASAAGGASAANAANAQGAVNAFNTFGNAAPAASTAASTTGSSAALGSGLYGNSWNDIFFPKSRTSMFSG